MSEKPEKQQRKLFVAVLAVAVALRVGLIFYSVYHDAHSNLKYTDVDYRVFSDAARYVFDRRICGDCQAQGPLTQLLDLNIGDPYARATYRYTPLLAVLLIPNEFLHPAFGKFLFATCDIIVGGLLYNILKRTNSRAYLWVGILWLLNPIVANISTRGSAESVLGAIVISTLSLALKGRMDAAAAMLGLAVHFKIYPFIYGASILAFLGSKAKGTKEKEGTVARIVALVTKERVRFTVVSLASFFMLNAVMFAIWGTPFLRHAYSYHLSRRDHRHNFSPYFYPIYLTYTNASSASSLLSFIPQMILSLGTGLLFGRKNLPLAWFVQTMAFVTLNKVCTSQYFLWYIWFLPLVLPQVRVSVFKAFQLVVIWIGAQAIWLSLAYQLEFRGKQVFLVLWAGSLLVLGANSYVLVQIVKNYSLLS